MQNINATPTSTDQKGLREIINQRSVGLVFHSLNNLQSGNVAERLFERAVHVKFHLTFQSSGLLRKVASSLCRRSLAAAAAAAVAAAVVSVRSACDTSLLAPAERTSV